MQRTIDSRRKHRSMRNELFNDLSQRQPKHTNIDISATNSSAVDLIITGQPSEKKELP